tara:strand:- start:323 stop:706 length:384 start_codon:yes stop_codon:yes gene_type:complete
MKRYRLELKKNESFEFEVFFKDRNSDGRDFDVNLDGISPLIIWDVIYYNIDNERVERLIPLIDYTTDNSILRNGYILIEMSAAQTALIPETSSTILWNLWVEHSTEKFDIASGSLKLVEWDTFEDPV